MKYAAIKTRTRFYATSKNRSIRCVTPKLKHRYNKQFGMVSAEHFK